MEALSWVDVGGTVAIALAVAYVLHAYVWTPASLARLLAKQQGLTVLPYRFFAGSLWDMKREEMRLQASQQHSSQKGPIDHNILPALFPFHSKVLSNLQTPGDGFVYWASTQPVLVVCNPEDAKDVLCADVKLLEKSELAARAFRKLLGNSLALANGQAWAHQRSLLRPAFFTEKLKDMGEDMCVCASQLAQLWRDQIHAQGPEVDVVAGIKSAITDILARTSFGLNYEQGKLVFQKQEQLVKLLTSVAIQNSIIPGYRFLPTAVNRHCIKLEKSIHEELNEIIESRRKARGRGESKMDLLGLILDANDQETNHITHQQVIDECKAFFMLGHMTTSSLLSWTIMLLAHNKEWQDKAREEVLQVCGYDNPKSEDMHKLKIVNMILHETLRLYPPVPLYGLRATVPNQDSFKLGNRLLPSGSAFILFCSYIHRDKTVWGEDALEFRPERFANGVSNACKHLYGFIPFGQGPRACIAQNLALMEAKVIMCIILKQFRFKLSPKYQHAPKVILTLEPKYGIQVIFDLL